jgi:Fe-S oxidoreductase
LNRFDHKEIHEVMDLCLSCKACKSECPSNVDMAKLKAEFLQHYYDANGVPFRSKLIANFNKSAQLGSIAPGIYNWMVTTPVISNMIKRFSGFAVSRSMPTLYKTSLKKWYKKRKPVNNGDGQTKSKKVYLFCDEFTNYNDTEIGIKAILLLEKLGYEVIIPEHEESGRACMSKGLLRKAKVIANKNISIFSKNISAETPLIGIEPSAILTFRDEYIDLADDENFVAAKELSKNVFIIDEFIASEIDKGNIQKSSFSTAKRSINYMAIAIRSRYLPSLLL